MSKRSLIAVLTGGLFASCVHAPPVHPRAVAENELCAQYIGQGDLTKAEVNCDLGLEFAPQWSDLWVNKGLIALKRNQIEVAKDDFIKALRYNNEQSQAYNDLGYIYLKFDKSYGKAHDNFVRALKVNPDYLEARYNLALTYLSMGDFPKARKEYLTILAINPNLADAYHDLGIMAIKEKEYEQAIQHLKSAVQLDPSYADSWLNLGIAYLETAKYKEALDSFSSCLEADHESIECRNNAAVAQKKGALLDPTLKQLQAESSTENTPQGYYGLGQTYKEKGLTQEEERAYKKCLTLDPKFPACHFGLYELFAEERRDSEGQIACKNFLKYAVEEEFPDQVQTCQKYLRKKGD